MRRGREFAHRRGELMGRGRELMGRRRSTILLGAPLHSPEEFLLESE